MTPDPEREETGYPAAGERPPASRHGLCPPCAHSRRVENDRGTAFLLCHLAKTDPRFSKYPGQPVMACAGFER